MGDTDFVPAPLLDWLAPATERAVMHTARLAAESEPGVMFDRGKPFLHRSHLPLINNVTAEYAPRWSPRWPAVSADNRPVAFMPRPWQAEAHEFFADRAGGILALEMRMGKCGAALMLWGGPSSGQLLIVGPLALRSTWRDACKWLYPDVPFAYAEGHSYDPDLKRAPIVFCHYDILSHWMGLFANRPALGVFDEVHVLAGYKADRTQTVKMIRGMCQRAIVLTGTPVWSKLRELHNVLQVACGAAFGHNFKNYGLKYCDGKPGKYAMDYSGVSNPERLRQRLSEVVFARSWEDVGSKPDIRRKVIKVPIDELTADKLDAELASLRSGDGKATQVGDLARYRRLISKIKAQAALESIQHTNSPLVAWTWHRQTCEWLAKQLGDRALHIHGGMADAARPKILDAWRDPSGPPIIVATIPVAQVGIDMSRATREVFCEVDYTPLVVAQAEMRAFAPGRQLDVEFFVADHMVDDKMTEALSRKLDAARKIGLPTGEQAVEGLVEMAAEQSPSEAPDMDALAAALLEDD